MYKNVAYLRVSTNKQDERRQLLSLENFNIKKFYIDKISGKSLDRPELNKMKVELESGDKIYCESISRLGRNVEDLREIISYFSQKKITVYFVKEGFNSNGDSSKFLLTILGAVAEMEREMINQRVREGVEKAKIYGTKSGIPFGRPKREIPENFEKYYKKMLLKEITKTEMAKLLDMSRPSVYRYIKQYEKEKMEEEK